MKTKQLDWLRGDFLVAEVSMTADERAVLFKFWRRAAAQRAAMDYCGVRGSNGHLALVPASAVVKDGGA